jgi:hypothetical protein
MEDIILVTGRDLARSWTNVVFSENQGGEQASFGVRVTGTSDVQWQVSLEDVRGAVVNNGPSGEVHFPPSTVQRCRNVDLDCYADIRVCQRISAYS